ncbi:hypothetical protein ABZW32_28155 [Streptomyces sp. NPDC004667]
MKIRTAAVTLASAVAALEISGATPYANFTQVVADLVTNCEVS